MKLPDLANDYVVIVPLYTKILVKSAESPERAITYAKNAVALNIPHVSLEPEEAYVFLASGEIKCHLVSEP